ncbi:actin-related protein 2/3 complex subunit 1A [Pseudohyphozyma bogoriensis]|nr:actin-related protein 2/3 complex subunit 1A [Pseudohyphozyma bogoriensis]
MSEIYQLTSAPLTAHAFNPTRSQVAVSPNTSEVHIYSKDTAGGWALSDTLTDHDKLVTSIDWAPNSNRIVTCSHDRNAYVWNPTPSGGWTPTLVLLRLNRSATYARWSPNEEKFAVASGARTIAVCQFDAESDWWVAKHIKKPLRTTVLGLDWHPNSVLLASGSADGVARVFSAYMKGVDSKPEPTPWGERLPFNTVCGEFASPSGGWVHAVAFSPSGEALAFASHDSTITLVYPSPNAGEPATIIPIPLPSLPLLSLVFTTETTIIGAGHDCQPYLFTLSSSGEWSLTKSLDSGASGEKKAVGGGGGAVGRLNNSAAFQAFRQADSRGVVAGGQQAAAQPGTRLTQSGTELLTVHQNSVSSIRAYSYGSGGDVEKVSSSGVDGRLVIWDVDGGVAAVGAGVGKLGI